MCAVAPDCSFFIEFGVIASAVWTACLAHEMYRVRRVLHCGSVPVLTVYGCASDHGCPARRSARCVTIGAATVVARACLTVERCTGNFATRRYKFYMGLSWVLAVAAACIAGFEGDFASAGGWCWVVNRFDLAQVLVVYVPLVGCLVFLVVTYTRISVRRSCGAVRACVLAASSPPFDVQLWIHATFRERMGIKQECQKVSLRASCAAVAHTLTVHVCGCAAPKAGSLPHGVLVHLVRAGYCTVSALCDDG